LYLFFFSRMGTAYLSPSYEHCKNVWWWV
jgi:hypothetical protein